MTRRNRKKEENVQDVNHFMHEVEEAMHLEKMTNLWNGHKVLIISSVAGLFAAVTAWQWFSSATETGLQNQSDSLWALERTAESNKAEAYESLMTQGTKGYKVLASFKTAAKHLESGNLAAALTVYDSVIHSKTSEEFIQLATFYKGLASMATDVASSEALFKEVAAAEGAFVYSAKEMLGIIAEQNADTEKAKKIYENIIVNPGIPQNMRARVQSRLDNMNRDLKKTIS